MKKLTENRLRRMIRRILLENSKVQTIERDYLDRVASGETLDDESPEQ